MQSAIMGKPLSSSSHDIFPVVQPHIHSWTKIYGNIYFQWYGAQAQLIVSEPELCTEILNDKQGVYRQRKSQGYLKKLFGDGLGLSEGEKWAKLRNLANHAVHSESLKSMIPAMISSVETTLERWKMHESKEIEVYEEFKLLTCDVISKTAFGSSYLEGNNFFEMLEKLVLLTFRNSFKFRFPLISKFFKTSDEIETEKVEKGMWKCIMEVIKKRQDKAMSSNDFGSDFLGILLKAHHDSDDKRRLSIDNVVDECKTFYLGGFHTTSSLLAWTVYLLALHTDWQEEARKEVFQLFGKENPKPDAITKLKIMDMIMNECLRLYTPVVSIGRRIEKEVKLGNIVVPANVELFVPNLGFHHDPQFWGQDANIFKPERFAEGVAKATNMHSTAFLPFGKGPRNCVGSNFATAEAKVAMSMILQRYSFSLSPGYVHCRNVFPCIHITNSTILYSLHQM